VRESATPDTVRLPSFDRIFEALPTDRAGGAEGAGETDRLLPRPLVGEVFGEEDLGNVSAGGPVCFHRVGEVLVASPVGHRVRI
jgi:hypothetical protein